MSAVRAVLDALVRADLLVEASAAPPEIRGIAEDSRRVTPGALFCAIAGSVADGHRYLGDARVRGAAAALVTRRVDDPLPQIRVRDGRRAAAVAAHAFYGRPADALRVVAVTGTNGKSTTVALIRHLLNAEGRVGSIGTLGAFDGAGRALAGYGPLTTPGPVELQAVLADLHGRGVDTVVMEVSSHALDQRRLETLRLAAAVYTNLTQDHLDYHADLDAYRDAKLRLSTYVTPGGADVVNADDPAWTALPEAPERRRVRYGRAGDADVRAAAARGDAAGTSLTLAFDRASVETRVPLPGEFNVSNALAAAATAWVLGLVPETIAGRLADAPQVPGRMERLVDGEFVIVRDYAHTPDALARAIRALRPVTRGRLIVLCGAGGERDRGKRPLMGRIAAREADLAVVTSDNPRAEDPERILDDIEAGMAGREHVRIVDRREAIRHAIGLLRSGDCLLLAGKGHETYQVVGTEWLPFDEREIVRAMLAERAPA